MGNYFLDIYSIYTESKKNFLNGKKTNYPTIYRRTGALGGLSLEGGFFFKIKPSLTNFTGGAQTRGSGYYFHQRGSKGIPPPLYAPSLQTMTRV